MDKQQPSIEFLELYAVVVAVKLWISRFQNRRIILFCDNMSVVFMINRNSSKCKHCMNLIRILVVESMVHNVRIFAKHVRSECNKMADLLSRHKFTQFKRLSKGKYDEDFTPIPNDMWPLEKVFTVHKC